MGLWVLSVLVQWTLSVLSLWVPLWLCAPPMLEQWLTLRLWVLEQWKFSVIEY